MATTEELILKVSADVGPLKKDMEGVKKSVADVGDETEKTSTKTQSSLSKLIPSWKEAGVAITGALVGMGAAGLEVISVAADADATTAKFNTVFKEYAAGTQQWADQYSSAAGRSRTDVMAWAASIQDTLVPMGYSREEAAKMSEQLVQTGVDLGSFYDQADSDVMEKITSGLVGNTENWREWGVVASENAIKQQLINMLGAEGAKNATEAQKLQARLNILMAGTKDAMGQAGREADQYQSQVKKLGGQIKDMMAEAGNGAMEQMAVVLKKVTDMMSNGGSDQLVYIFAALANAVAWATGEVVDIIGAFEQWGNSGLFNTLREFSSVVMQNFRDSLGGAYQAIQNFVGSGGLDRLGQVVNIIIQDFTIFYRILGDLGVYSGIGAAVGFVVNGFLGFIDIISRVIIAVNGFGRSFLTTIANVLDSVGLVVPGAKDMADGIRDELAKLPADVSASLDPALPNAVTGPVNKAGTDGKQASSEAVTGIADEWGKLPTAAKDKIDPGLSNFITGGVSSAGQAGKDAAASGVAGIAGEYGRTPGAVGDAVSGTTEVMRSHSKVAGDAGVQIAKENVIHVGQAYSTLPYQASQAIAPLAPAVEHQVKIADGPSTAAAAATVQHTGTEFGKLPGMAGTQLAPLNQAVLAPINTTKLSSGTAVTGLVANVVANFVPLPMRAGSAVAPLGANTTPHFVSARTSAENQSAMMAMGINARLSPIVPQSRTTFQNMSSTITSVMSTCIGSVSNLGSGMYNAAAGIVQRAMDGLNSKIASLRSLAASVMSLASGGSGSSSSGGSSIGGSSGSGSSGSHTGIITGAPTYSPSPVRPVSITINNNAVDVRTAQNTTYTAVKAGVYGKARSV